MDNTLQFPRGDTASGGDINIPTVAGHKSVIPTTTGLYLQATPYRPDLASLRPQRTLDDQLSNGGTVGVAGTILVPGTMQPIKLRAVQASAAITVSKHSLLIQFSTTAKHLGVVAHATYTGADGVICKPIDGAYPIDYVIAKWDWFWVVEEGPAYVAIGNGKTLTWGQGCSCGGSGLADTAAAGDPVFGTAQQTITGDGTEATDYALISVCPGIQDSPAA